MATKEKKPLSEIASRMNIIYKEWKDKDYHKGYEKFTKLLGMSSTGHVFDMLNGNKDISLDFVNAACNTLGYNSEWVNFGTGDKRRKKKQSTRMHDIVKIMQDNEFLRNEIRRINARMTGLEREITELKGETSQTLHKQFS